MDDRVDDPTLPMIWESHRIEASSGAFIAAASAAGIGVSIVSVDPEPRLVYISDKGVEILGHPREAVLGRSPNDFLTPEERDKSSAFEALVRSDDGPHSFETVVLRADGTRVPLEISFAHIHLDGGPGLITFTRDVTRRRRGMEALQRFRELIEHAPDAVFINDGRRLTFANPAAVRMLRYPDAESLLAIDPRTLFTPEDGASMAARSQEMKRTGKGLPPRDYPTRRRDGTFVLTEVQSMPIEWEGAPSILGFARDVTERKEMEARLAQSERLAALGTLLAGIAHEMNNPLSYTLLGIEQALAQLGTLGAPATEVAKLRETLDGARHGATRVAAVIGQIRASSRPTNEAEQGPVELRAVIEAALRVTHNEIHHRARLVTEIGDVPTIRGCAQRLEQVFLNLLVNATQALPDGRADNEIRVVLRATPARQVVVEVSDNGPGIPEEVRSRIFDPFFTTKPVGLGLGLGLSICHGIITNHGGTITAESELGRGSTFRVVLPVAAEAPAEPPRAAPAARSPDAPARRRRVLVIDDEPALATMISRILSREYHVDVTIDAREGLERLAGPDPYDVVLCDLMMPNMTGMDLFAEVARRQPGLEQRFVFMTGGAFTPRATEFLAQVKNRRLEKPFETSVLKATVAQDND
jgi:PAS domain S-box-containing protein